MDSGPTNLVFSNLPGFLRPVADSAAGQDVGQEQGVDQSGLAQPRLAQHQDHKLET